MDRSKKSYSTVFLEACVVGVLLILITFALDYLTSSYSHQYKRVFVLFMSGFLFHVAFEYSGLNIWYVTEYSKLLN
jgi:hypothetical protein